MSTSRIEQQFIRTKLMCFGRYALVAPENSHLNWGTDDFETFPNQAKDLLKIMEAKRTNILAGDKTAEVTYFGKGPAPTVAWIRSYKSAGSKQVGLEGFQIYHLAGPHIFRWQTAIAKSVNSTLETITQKTIFLAENLRPRTTEEAPKEPGLCLEYGFLRNSPEADQEYFAAGLVIDAFPDVTFSVQSNKNASTKDGNGDGLLKQIADQRGFLGRFYPRLNTLREGKKQVHGWAGEESLVRRKDGAHDFEWKFIGETGNVAKPALLNVTMYSKVKADRIGAAAAASLTDEEAIALWDRLLDGLKFRVAVPGAPDDAVAIKTP